MVCGLPQAFGLRNDEGVKGNDFFFFSVFCGAFVVYGLLRFARNDEKRTVIAKAIIPTSSLRRPKACGNLVMVGY